MQGQDDGKGQVLERSDLDRNFLLTAFELYELEPLSWASSNMDSHRQLAG